MTISRAKRVRLGLVWAVTGLAPAQAAPWEFDKPVTVANARPGVFHHLESAGRAGIAVAAGTVAVVWEDNRDGAPRAYVAFGSTPSPQFRDQRLSGALDAYEPVVVALPDGRFAFGWEEGGQVWVRTGGPSGLGASRRLSQGGAAQITLAAGRQGLVGAWAERTNRHLAIRLARLSLGPGGAIEASAAPVWVTPPPVQDQLYPALAVLDTDIYVAWEDRRAGHTEILYSRALEGGRFVPARVLNAQRAKRSPTFGRGTGAARVVLARIDAGRAAAVWLDKRDFEGGYDVYAAETTDAAAGFGANHRVQDEFGANIGQWHATLAGRSDGVEVCVWDDDRDGSADLWLSWKTPEGWSSNLAVPGAGGPGPDTSPVATLDPDGSLLLAWLSRDQTEGPTRLMYVRGRPTAR